MKSITSIKVVILGMLSAVGAFFSSLFGGWDSALTTLIIFMAIIIV